MRTVAVVGAALALAGALGPWSVGAIGPPREEFLVSGLEAGGLVVLAGALGVILLVRHRPGLALGCACLAALACYQWLEMASGAAWGLRLSAAGSTIALWASLDALTWRAASASPSAPA